MTREFQLPSRGILRCAGGLDRLVDLGRRGLAQFRSSERFESKNFNSLRNFPYTFHRMNDRHGVGHGVKIGRT